MSKMSRMLAMAFVVAIAAAPAGVGAKAPDKQVLAPDSPDALIVIKTDFWPPAPSMKSAFKLALSRFDPAEEKLMGGPFSGVLIEAQRKNFTDGYLVKPIKPGRWVFLSYSQQTNGRCASTPAPGSST